MSSSQSIRNLLFRTFWNGIFEVGFYFCTNDNWTYGLDSEVALEGRPPMSCDRPLRPPPPPIPIPPNSCINCCWLMFPSKFCRSPSPTKVVTFSGWCETCSFTPIRDKRAFTYQFPYSVSNVANEMNRPPAYLVLQPIRVEYLLDHHQVHRRFLRDLNLGWEGCSENHSPFYSVLHPCRF